MKLSGCDKLFYVGWVVNVMKKLADLGERAAIQQISEIVTKRKMDFGIGDDCAVIDLGKKYLLVTTDIMYQQTHIPEQMTPYQMGWSLVAINLSDIAAKGGTPLGLVLSLGFPKTISEEFLKELIKGADACAVAFNTTIVGGDTKEMQEITLCGTAFGAVKKDEFMPRKGAHSGDVVAVTGSLGKAGAGYYALQLGISTKQLLKPFLEPIPKIKEGRLLAKQHFVTSSMDLSDGLSASLYQLREINKVGFEIKQNTLPLASEIRFLLDKNYDIDPYSIALHFGGDYELLVTIPAGAIEQTKKTLRKHGLNLIIIGKATRNKDIILLDGKNKRILENKGYEHFKKHYFLKKKPGKSCSTKVLKE